MSELTYKKIVDVEQVETLNGAATVFINDNGAMKQVAADKFGAVKSIDGIMPDETGNIKYGRSNPIPFNKAGNTINCTMPFAEAIAIASSGTNQANVTLALSTFDANTSLLISETKYASSVTVGIKAGTGEKLWLQADFDVDDGSVIRLQLNPDESVTETIIKPEGNAGGSGGAFVVNITNNGGTITADKTFAELDAAYQAGQMIRCKYVQGANIFLEYTLLHAVLGQGYAFTMLQYVQPISTFQYGILMYMADGSITEQTQSIMPATT